MCPVYCQGNHECIGALYSSILLHACLLNAIRYQCGHDRYNMKDVGKCRLRRMDHLIGDSQLAISLPSHSYGCDQSSIWFPSLCHWHLSSNVLRPSGVGSFPGQFGKKLEVSDFWFAFRGDDFHVWVLNSALASTSCAQPAKVHFPITIWSNSTLWQCVHSLRSKSSLVLIANNTAYSTLHSFCINFNVLTAGVCGYPQKNAMKHNQTFPLTRPVESHGASFLIIEFPEMLLTTPSQTSSTSFLTAVIWWLLPQKCEWSTERWSGVNAQFCTLGNAAAMRIPSATLISFLVDDIFCCLSVQAAGGVVLVQPSAVPYSL